MATVKTITNEPKRGCGFRKPGGLYLVCDGLSTPCGKLPIPLTVCPCCGAGIKHSLGWTWVNARRLAEGVECTNEDCSGACPLHTPPEKAGLLWIGESFYKSPLDWMNEARLLGVSRKIASVPRGFKVGEDWVLVAHRKATIISASCQCEPCEYCKDNTCGADGCCDECGRAVAPDAICKKCNNVTYIPAIFHAFKPDRIEYIVKGSETEDELDELERRGLTLVKLERTDGQDKHTMKWHRHKHISPDGDSTYYVSDEGYSIQSYGSVRFEVMSRLGELIGEAAKLSEAKQLAEEYKESKNV